jgi:tetratricopeptide (TPR) repeat protein
MISKTIDSFLAESEKLRFSKPHEAYALVQKASQKALRSKDLLRLASANELKASLARVLGEIDTAHTAIQSALLYYKATKNIGKEGKCLILIGQIAYDRGNVEKAFRYYEEAERLVKTISDYPEVLAITYGLQGNVKLTMGKPAEALKYLIKSLHICEKNNLDREIGNSYQGLASFYFLEEDYDKALLYSDKALPIFKLWGDKYRECFNLNSRGIIYIRKHEFKKSFDCFSQAVKLANELGMIYMRVWSYSNLIEHQIHDKKNTDAERLIKKLVSLSTKELDVVSQATIFSSVGSFYIAVKKPDLAIKNLRSAIQKFSSSEYGRLQMLEKLLEIFIQTNDAENSIKTLQEYLALKDEIFSLQNQREINIIESNSEKQSNSRDEKLEKYSQHRFEKNAIIFSLKEKLKFTGKSKISIEKIDDQMKQISDSFDHELHISVTYNDFLMRLSKRFPNLSSTERKIATLLRLNMSSKKIASLFSISVRTVEYHRTNIRRKLNLKTKDNIQLFLMKI